MVIVQKASHTATTTPIPSTNYTYNTIHAQSTGLKTKAPTSLCSQQTTHTPCHTRSEPTTQALRQPHGQQTTRSPRKEHSQPTCTRNRVPIQPTNRASTVVLLQHCVATHTEVPVQQQFTCLSSWYTIASSVGYTQEARVQQKPSLRCFPCQRCCQST